MMLTENFELEEFTNNFEGELSTTQMENVKKLADNLQKLRSYTGKLVMVTSGVRSIEHNQEVGGVPNSRHLYGQAADIKVEGMTTEQVANAIEQLIASNVMVQGGLGIYDTWVHYDVRGTKARWDNRKKKVKG